MTKVVAVSHASERNGAELSLKQICSELRRRGIEVIVTVPDNPADESVLTGDWEIHTVRTRMWMGRRYNFIVGSVRLVQALFDTFSHVRLLLRTKPDVVVVNTCVIPAPVLACRILKIPVVMFVREAFVTNPSLRSVVPRSVLRRFIRDLPNLVVANSWYVRDQFGSESTVKVVYPPISDAYRQAAKTVSERGSEQLSVQAPTCEFLRIVHVGSIGGDKGQEDVLDALKILHSEGVPFTASFYGGGAAPLVQAFGQMVEGLRGSGADVNYHGAVQDVYEAYASADVTVVCSLNEAFGKVTLESIASGTPVVGYAAGGTAEILALGGGLAIPANPRSLAYVLRGIQEDRYRLASLRESCFGHPLLHGDSAVAACDLIQAVRNVV